MTRTSGTTASSVAKAINPRMTQSVLRRRPEPTYLDGRLSGERRKRLRRQRRNLEAALGGPVTIEDVAGSDFGPALERRHAP